MKGKHITNSDYNKFTKEILDERIKQNELVNKSDVSNLLKDSNLNKKLGTLATESDPKAEQDIIATLQTHDLSCFLGEIFFGDEDSQIIFVYQPTRDTLELKKGKGTDYVLSWKSKEVYTSKLKQLYTAFLHSMKLSGYKVRKKFDRDSLSIEQSNYATKILNAHIVYDLIAWSKNSTNNFKLENSLISATNILKNSDKEMWVYTGYGIAFDEACSWNISNDFARNVKLFGINNSSSSHTDIRKKKFLVLGEGRTYGSFGSPEKKFSINFSKANTTFCSSLHYKGIVICLLMGRQSLILSLITKMWNFQLSFV